MCYDTNISLIKSIPGIYIWKLNGIWWWQQTTLFLHTSHNTLECYQRSINTSTTAWTTSTRTTILDQICCKKKKNMTIHSFKMPHLNLKGYEMHLFAFVRLNPLQTSVPPPLFNVDKEHDYICFNIFMGVRMVLL